MTGEVRLEAFKARLSELRFDVLRILERSKCPGIAFLYGVRR
jgi:hypothetical protein